MGDKASSTHGAEGESPSTTNAGAQAGAAAASTLDGVDEAKTALERATHIGELAAAVGFDWPDIDGVRAKVAEEQAEEEAEALESNAEAMTNRMAKREEEKQAAIAAAFGIIFCLIAAFVILSLFIGAVCGGMADALSEFTGAVKTATYIGGALVLVLGVGGLYYWSKRK
jgi:hypothetical protein